MHPSRTRRGHQPRGTGNNSCGPTPPVTPFHTPLPWAGGANGLPGLTPLPCRPSCFRASLRSRSHCVPQSSSSRASSASSAREACALPNRTPRPAASLADAMKPPGAPKSLRPPWLRVPASPGWLGGLGHRDGSGEGGGFAPTPTPESSPPSRGLFGRNTRPTPSFAPERRSGALSKLFFVAKSSSGGIPTTTARVAMTRRFRQYFLCGLHVHCSHIARRACTHVASMLTARTHARRRLSPRSSSATGTTVAPLV